MKSSPLRPDAPRLPWPRIVGGRGAGNVEEGAAQAIASLNAEGYWLSQIRSTSNPYKGDGPKEIPPGDFASSNVGDDSDTSPFPAGDRVMGISVATYTNNLGALIRFLETKK